MTTTPNTHLSPEAYLDDAALGRRMREQVTVLYREHMAEDHPGKRPPRVRVDFFHDAENEEYGVETYLNNKVHEIVTGDTLLDAIVELLDG